MGYFIQADVAVPARTPGTHTRLRRPSGGGLRYYIAELGRWASADPGGESGGLNLLTLLLNNPVNATDFLGLFGNPVCGPSGCYYPPDPCWGFCPTCCGGKVYDPKTHCCCKGKIVAKKPIPTGIFYHETDNVALPGTKQNHWWLQWPGGTADANAPGNVGKIGVPAYYPGPDISPPTPVELSPCYYDFDAIYDCISKATTGQNGKSEWKKCLPYIQGLVGGCMVEGCTAK